MNSREQLISIVTPVYNCHKYIRECVMNVLEQSYPYWELLLIDDGSTDGTDIDCDQFEAKDNRIKVIHQSNEGVSAARNTGLEKARGDYIAFLDADDWWDQNYLEQMINALDSFDFPTCALNKVHPNGDNQICAPLDFSFSPTRNIIACWRGLYLNTILAKYNLRFTTTLKTGEDQEFVYKYLLYCHHPGYVKDAIYYYRINVDSAMHQRSYVQFDAVEAMKGAVKYVHEHGTVEQLTIYERDLLHFNAIRTIEFAILTLLTAGESWKKVYGHLQEHGYVAMIDEALKSGDCYQSFFYDLWKKSPENCLRYYAFIKFLVRLARNIGIH